MDGRCDPHALARKELAGPSPEEPRHRRARAPARKRRSEAKTQQHRSNASVQSTKAARMPTESSQIPAKTQGVARRRLTAYVRSARVSEAETKGRFAASRKCVAHLAG